MSDPSSAPVQAANPEPPEDDEDEGAPPRLQLTGRSLLIFIGFLAASLAALYYLLPQLAGLQDTWHRIEDGSPWWMLLALLFTFGMFVGYVMQFRGVFGRAETRQRIDWRESYQITMAGLAASRIFAAGGAGGLVLMAWALRRAGMRKREVADKTLSFLILTYFPYVIAVIVCGIGLRIGLFSGPDPFGLTVVPAILAVIALAIGLSIALVPTDLQRRVGHVIESGGTFARVAQRLAHLPASASAGMRDAIAHVRTGDPALLGAIIFWASQILVLWAAFHAFGDPPPWAVLIQAFFVGMLGNLLPMPGGVGGVEGGMIGALVAFDVDGGLAVVAVLVYRAFTFWLPLIPGVIAYFQLRKTVERWALHYTK
ncbi:MAG TPA: lysylphosphatidylglycerol synthase transmembrane domain-containing protein [Solirubrobacteraceae bacterium]|jgi:uncharacterized protein (TIRG00374 family)|nr:lysylphosphatidylglycerol synthase transmembrane domain-containing protein [Solirubrobacteraceae bacterium]